MDDNERGGLVGLALGIGLGLWSTMGDGGVGIGVLAIAVIVGSVAWAERLGVLNRPSAAQ